jgi:predicted negative regulator of RcsB-dependent stress response
VDDYTSEKEQWEEVKRLAREYGPWIGAGIVIGVGTLYGYRFWQARQDAHALEAHDRYGEVLNDLYRAKVDDAVKVIAQLDASYSGTPYADQARLALARWYVDQGKMPEAATALTRVMDKAGDKVLRMIARLRLARVLAEQHQLDEALRVLDQGGSSAFDPRYQEVRGDILLAKGDRAGALAAYRAAAASNVPGIVNEDMLRLKIADLADVARPAAETAAVGGDAAK